MNKEIIKPITAVFWAVVAFTLGAGIGESIIILILALIYFDINTNYPKNKNIKSGCTP